MRQILRERILNGFEHGQRFHSERELIEKLAVSQPTIRRALNDLVAEGYLLPEPRRGFFVQRKTETRHVGFILPELSRNSLGIEYTVCREQGCLLDPHYLHRNDRLNDLIRSIKYPPSQERLLIAGLTVDLTLALSSHLRMEGYQHIVLGPKIPGLACGTIMPDYETEVDQVIDHLTGLGHERILFMVNEPEILLITSLRSQLVHRKIEERGLRHARVVSCQTQNWDSSYDAAYRKADEIFGPGSDRREWPTAVAPLSGVGAWAVLRYAMRHGIRVPEDISLLSFDAIENADILPVPLTEMTFSPQERIEKAITLLWGPDADKVDVRMTPKLVVRESTAAPRG
ncbi:LacI family DNA-binding transcriptional regulator [Verrucomicrobium sp. GAS474]|uniref:substrate-binding domain-containing protein n=1 Tax=Verrucomicrobium sp. GAS474 TaxID=1882831 RepID=UPI0013903F3E|nr:LacI family DNA-binding transcriptional regulator [Verrucomicrobium sp. GAS474]